MRHRGALYLLPTFGLCNRMRTIAAGYQFAREHQYLLRVLWVQDDGLAARFDELFEPLPDVAMHEIGERRKLRNRLAVAPFVGQKPALLKSLRQTYFDQIQFAWDENSATPPKRILHVGCEEFYRPGQSDYSIFKPVEKIRRQVDAIAQHFNEHTLGLHIRRTDNTPAIEISTDELFIEKINERIAACPGLNIFLATDCPETDQRFRDKFGVRIHDASHRAYGRDNPRGMESAAVDLYCLSRTTQIIGSYWSSYSVTAARITQIPVSTLGLDPIF